MKFLVKVDSKRRLDPFQSQSHVHKGSILYGDELLTPSLNNSTVNRSQSVANLKLIKQRNDATYSTNNVNMYGGNSD
jgi:hypothetical protein